MPTRTLFGVPITGPTATPATRYLVVLGIVIVMTWLASNLVHGRIGRMWMAVRDMDIAAELIGIRLYRTKLLAFAVSSFYCGVAGALMVFIWLGAAEADSFNINQSFLILFMVIIGGLGSLIGSFFGAAFIWGLPIVLRAVCPSTSGCRDQRRDRRAPQFMIVGALIIFFLIVEPHGLARLWQIGKQKLRVWPFPVLMVHTRAQFPPRACRRADKPWRHRRREPEAGVVAATAGMKTKGGTRCDCKHLVLGARRCGAASAPSALATEAQAQDSIYVPLLTYRTGPFAGSRHSDRQRHARLPRHAQRARRRHRRRQDHGRGMRDRLRHQEGRRVLRAGQGARSRWS